MFEILKKLLPSPSLVTAAAGRTDIGRIRKNNEDCWAILEGRNLYLVADGMGGHKAGEIASNTTAEIMRRHYSRKRIAAMKGNQEEVRHAMINSFELANQTIIDLASEDEDLHGMGCTLVMVFIDGNLLHTCHVGDARCYLASGDGLQQITTDHTTLMEMQNSGKQSPPTQEPNLNRHVVTRVIGYPFPEPPEFSSNILHEKDRILLCTDGLWSMLDDSTIYQTLTEASSPSLATNQLVDLANAAGGNDNITALAIFC